MTDSVRVLVVDLRKKIDMAVRALVLDIVANLLRSPKSGGTPVDTGWARANWVPSIGVGPTDVTGTPKSFTQSRLEAGQATIATSYKTKDGPAYITNNVPYILRLNEGSSQQAPAGFVQDAITKAIAERQ